MELAPGMVISVKGYNILHRQKPARTCFIWLGGEDPKIAINETTRVDENERAVASTELKKAYKFGGEYVYFTPEEQKKLKNWAIPSQYKGKVLRIIGFKPQDMLPNWASVKRSIFIFPSEEGYIGSTRVFAALWAKLLKDKKMGIAWFVPRVNANPMLVAILPSKAPSDDDVGDWYLPTGLWLYPLPFADDVREFERRQTQRASDGLTDQMRTIVQNLQLPKAVYNPLKYPNPSLQWHYKILQTLALEEEVPEQGEDTTKPKYKAINHRVGGYMVEFKEGLEKEALALQRTRAFKREAEDDGDERPAKRAKAKVTGSSMSLARLKMAFQQGTLGKMTVAELKEVLLSKGISPTGKKADLVERLEQWVEANA
jgi:ATP-dependent DNA helicase 2 subunit 1